MKIIGKSSGSTYLVEATDDELAKAAGYGGSYDGAWRKLTAPPFHGADRLPVGTQITVAAHDWLVNLRTRLDEADKAAGILRSLADLITVSIPRTVLIPKQEISTGQERVDPNADWTKGPPNDHPIAEGGV